MQISDLIFELQEKESKFGDIDVKICVDIDYVYTHIPVGTIIEDRDADGSAYILIVD